MKAYKTENGLGLIGTIVLIILIIITVVVATILVVNRRKNQSNSEIKSNMQLVQAACRVLKDDEHINKDRQLVGTKLSDYEDEYKNITNEIGLNEISTEETEQTSNKKYDEIIIAFKKSNIVPTDKYDKYYVLSNDDLTNFKLSFQNPKDAYYIANYEDNEVIYTKGIDGIYKLSEMKFEEDISNIIDLNETNN